MILKDILLLLQNRFIEINYQQIKKGLVIQDILVQTLVVFIHILLRASLFLN